MYRHVDTVRKRFEIERRRPGVVHDDGCALAVRDLGDCGDVLHFKGEGTGGLNHHDGGVGAHQCLDARADQRIVELDFDAKAREEPPAHAPHRAIG